MTYDSRRGKVVLYGGFDRRGALLHDTWEYDGSTWTQRADAGPPKSVYHRMVFDVARGKIVLFGGFGEAFPDVPTAGETWEWDGTRWEMKAVGVAPEVRLAPAITYDIISKKVLLYGGGLLQKNFNDTWEWDGNTWIQAAGGALPSARSRHAMAYEFTRMAVVMFGGLDGGGILPLNDTWIWAGSTWRHPALTLSPSPRADHAMAYDIARDRTVLFGGADSIGQALADTWEWDGTRWLERTPAVGPPARTGHAMVYDAARRQLLLMGGSAGGILVADQWAWDGNHWTDVTPDRPPPRRSDFAIAYDALRDKVVLFGGRGESGLLGDTWEWDGTQWIERTSAAGPAARSGHTLTYDPTLQSVVLFGGRGGSDRLDDLWAWDGTSWIELPPGIPPYPPLVPSARQHHAMVYDAARRNLVLFGGDDTTTPGRGDLWFLRFGDPVVHDEACETGFDGDGDGKSGCEDPDCAGLCASCGNGVCDAFESCRLCPGDCEECRACGDFRCEPSETCSSCPGDCGPCP